MVYLYFYFFPHHYLEDSLNKALNKIYELLDEKDITEKSDDNYPKLECFFETGNETQKNYCIQV